MAHFVRDPMWLASKTLELAIRADATTSAAASATTTASAAASRPPAYKAAGISLAVGSGLFIGTSFVLKKVGLLKANEKYHEEAGEGYGYLKNAYWWTGMTLMIIGEICNFVAYAFVDAILVTPMGALSVVVTTILSAIFLKERLSFVGKAGCFICILGAVIIPLNAPEHSAVADIQEMQAYVIAPGFLSYAGVILVGCAFTAFWAGPRYGKKSMMVYLTICSLIGGLSVVATQGLGSAIIAQIGGEKQYDQWFLYVLFVFVVATLLTEIIFLNKALNIFNAALVTPTYYVYFTSATIVTSAVLFQGFGGSVVQIITMILGFLVICSGVVLLQMSKSAKDVPDAAIFAGDLDQMRTIAEQEQPDSEPKADTFRGTAGLIRAISKSRRKMEHEEALKIAEEKRKDELEPIGENEVVEWDGLRRRKTTIGSRSTGSVRRTPTIHPPLGMSSFPTDDGDDDDHRPTTSSAGGAFGFGFRRKSRRNTADGHGIAEQVDDGFSPAGGSPVMHRDGSVQMGHVYGLPEGLKALPQHDGSGSAAGSGSRGPIHWADDVEDNDPSSAKTPSLNVLNPNKRTFSFQNVFRKRADEEDLLRAPSSRASNKSFGAPKLKDVVSEEERLGLVKGDSHLHMPETDELSDRSDTDISDDPPQLPPFQPYEDYDSARQRYSQPVVPAQGGSRAVAGAAVSRGSVGHPLPQTPEVDEDDERDFHEAQRQAPRGAGSGAGGSGSRFL